ncbi:MAG: ribonuclease Z [Cytophagia bacterium]|nr:ribonuclease Z [Cytophagia bacterium]
MSFSITILGSSGALPAYGRFPSAQFIEIQNRYFLVDCGEGTQMQLRRYELNVHRINHIFISHLHGDHYLGLMGLLFTLHLQKRTTELHLYSHAGLEEIITVQLRYSKSVLNYPIIFHPLTKDKHEIIFEDDHLQVESIPLTHKLTCSGFLFREKPKAKRIDKNRLPDGLLLQQIAALKSGQDVVDENGKVLYKNEDLTLSAKHSRSYAYCSDTAYEPKLIPLLKDVDLLYHEATFIEEDKLKAKETKHSTALEAAQIAKQAGVRKLALGHFSARYKDLIVVEEEAKSIFNNTVLATEGQTFSLEE